MEYIITKEEIKWINEQYDGTLRSDAEIETALSLGKGKSIYRKIAYMLRAVLVGHPFTDGNKRTALMVAIAMLEKCHMKSNEEIKERITEAMKKIAQENITDVNKIERMIRHVITGN